MTTLIDSQVELKGVSKRYNIYAHPTDRLREIVLRNKRSYHKEFWALRDFNFRFPTHTTAVLGPNGCGKSTLLQIIAGVLTPTTGTLERQGRVTAILELGAGFQPESSGRENALLYGMILGIPKDDMLEKLEDIASFAEVGDFFDQPIKTYSSGMIVRLAFACATSVEPDILLIDEALSVGDDRFKYKCLDRITKLQAAAKTIIFVSHNMVTVRDFCQSAILLNGGKIVAHGKPDEITLAYEELMQDKNFVPKVFSAPATIL